MNATTHYAGYQPEIDIEQEDLEAVFAQVNAEEFDAMYALEVARQTEPETPTLEDDYPW